MELDNKGLGRLRRVANARDVWTSEAGDFTPWLAENLDVLADELGMSPTLVAIEVTVGEFRLDIQAQAPDGGVVIVENQLERTDHGHLGQLLVYASGLEARAVVWVAPRFRDDHLAQPRLAGLAHRSRRRLLRRRSLRRANRRERPTGPGVRGGGPP